MIGARKSYVCDASLATISISLSLSIDPCFAVGWKCPEMVLAFGTQSSKQKHESNVCCFWAIEYA